MAGLLRARALQPHFRAANLFHRAYSTPSEPISPESQAKVASSPLQVSIRRTQTGTLDVDHDRVRYDKLVAKAELVQKDGSVPSYEEWLERMNARRRRVRGTRTRRVDGEGEEAQVVEEVVGRRIYLPNITFRLMRNHTPPGQPYNPYEATFRIPQSVTKLDVRAYLKSVYGVECTYIRTDNYIAPIERDVARGNQRRRKDGKNKTYKRAVVGLVKPFVYPDAIEDMPKAERDERHEWLEETFQLTALEEQRRKAQQGMFTNNFAGLRSMTTKRSTILENVMKRRIANEELVKNATKKLVESGVSPFGAGSLKVGTPTPTNQES